MLGLVLIALGVGISLHLRASHFAHWWVPGAVLLMLTHGAIVGVVVWMVSRLRGQRVEPTVQATGMQHTHTHPHEQSKVLHRPRLYDWLVRLHTFGSEHSFRNDILQVAQLQPNEMVLDVGCGTGSLLIEAARQRGSGDRLHGVEPSAEMLAHARRKAQGLIAEANFVQGSADRIPFPDASFDVVFCTMVLHHLPAGMQIASVREMRRIVRPGGRLVLVDMQRPKSIAAKFSIVTLFHKFATDATAPDWQSIERVLREREIESASLHPMWNGAVCALVIRVPLSSAAHTEVQEPTR